MILKLTVLTFITVIISVISFAQGENKNSISNSDFAAKLSDSTLTILDVRTPSELNGPLDKIEGVINLPVQELEGRIDELEKYKSKEIFVICRTGHRSGIATEILIKHGFNAINVLGGMTELRANEKNE